MIPDLILLGNLLLDDIVLPSGRTLLGEPGGAMLHASLGASLWGAGVGLVSVRGDDYPAPALESLAARGVRLDGLRPLGGPGVRTWLLYEGDRRRVVHQLDRPSHADVSPVAADVPQPWRSARCFHVCPMPLARQGDLVRALREAAPESIVTLDPHEPVDEESFAAYAALWNGLDVFFGSDDELRLAAPGDAGAECRALRRIARAGVGLVVARQGSRGGVLYEGCADRYLAWEPRASEVVDPTGAGDAFAGGFLAGRIAGAPLGRCLEQAVVSASFALEDWGARGSMAATPDAAASRRQEWFGASPFG